MELTQKQIQSFRKKILTWFEKNKRDLPWRHPSLPTSLKLRGSRKLRNGLPDPYAILVSEVMLQQTQVVRVIPKFEAWMKTFPTVHALAQASTKDVLLLWSGLGYNRRAVYLQKLANEIVKNYKSEFPQDEKTLCTLPGIGKYTARAILCFAFDKQIAVVDTNVRKVILVYFKNVILSETKDIYASFSVQHDKLIQKIANMLLPKGKAYEWNQALMDYASAKLKKEKIAIPHKTPFKNSNRFYRGQIIRLLLQQSKTGAVLFGSLTGKGITKVRFQQIVRQMQKEQLIVLKNKKYALPE